MRGSAFQVSLIALASTILVSASGCGTDPTRKPSAPSATYDSAASTSATPPLLPSGFDVQPSVLPSALPAFPSPAPSPSPSAPAPAPSSSPSVAVPSLATSQIQASPASGLLANGTDSSTITVTLKDAAGNPLSGRVVTLSLTGSGTLTQPSAATNAAGETTATLTSSVSGSRTVSIATPTEVSALQTSVSFHSGLVDASQSSFTLSTASALVADGVATLILTATLKDSLGNPVSGESVTFASTGSGNQITQPSSTTDAFGQASGSLKSTVAEIKTLTLTAPSGLAIPALTRTHTFVPGAASASTSTLSASPSSGLTADGSGSATLTVTVRDAQGNPIPSQSVILSTSGGSLVQPSVTTNAQGQTTGSLSSTESGTKTVSITSPASLSSLSTQVSFGAGLVDPSRSLIQVSAASGTLADGTATVNLTAVLKDSNDNPVPGQVVSFTASGTQNTLTQPSVVTNAAGEATGTLATTRAESKTIGIAAPSGLSAVTAVTSFRAGDPVLAQSTLSAAPATGVVADGSDESTISVTLKDAFANPVPAQTVTFSVSGGTGNTATTPTTTNAAGSTTLALTSTSGGTKTLTLTGPAGVSGKSVTVDFVAPLGCLGAQPAQLLVPASSPVSTTTQNLILSGTCALDSTLTLTGDLTAGDAVSPANTLTQSCAVDGTFQFELSKVSDGTFSLQLATLCGAQTLGSSSLLWHRDTTAPGAPVITSPAADPHTTHMSTMVLAGTCDAGNTVELSGLSAAQTACNSLGKFQFTITAPSDGNHTLLVRQKDSLGNASPWVTRSWILDSSAPATPTLISPNTSPYSSSDSLVNLQVSCEPGATVGISGDASSVLTCAAGGSALFALNKTLDGEYHFEVMQNDAAGNASGALLFDWIKDTTIPMTPVITSPSSTPVYTQATPLTITGTCAPGDRVQLGGSIELGEIQTPLGQDSVPCSGSGSFSFVLNKNADGVFNLQFSQVDPAENASASSSLVWVRDSQAPAPPALTAPNTSPHVAPGNLSLSGTCEPQAQVLLTGDLGAHSASCSASGTFSFSQTLSVDGTYALSLRQQDRAGNLSSNLSQTWVRNSTAPAPVTITLPSSATVTNNLTALTLQGTCTPDRIVELSGIPASAVSSPANSLTQTCPSGGSFSYQLSRSSEGSDTLILTQSYGGFTSAQTQRVWTRDLTAPNTTFSPTPPTQSFTNTLTFSFSSSEAGGSFECVLDGGAPTTCTSPLTLSNLVNGAHTLSVAARDPAGNLDASPVTANFTIQAYKTLALYHFAGTNPLADSSLFSAPENNPLTTVGGATANPGKFNGAWKMTNTTTLVEHLSAADNQSQDLARDVMTVEVWAKATALTANSTYYILASKMGTAGQYGWEMRLTRANSSAYRLSFGASLNGTSTPTIRTLTTTCVSGTALTTAWNHFAVTWNKGTITFFCNGARIGTSTIGTVGSASIFQSNAPLRLGESGYTTTNKRAYKGELDEFRMSNVLRWTNSFTVPSAEYSGAEID
jgi:hypothetical protein